MSSVSESSTKDEHNDSYSVCSSIDSNDSENTIIKKLEKLELKLQESDQEQKDLELAIELSKEEYLKKYVSDMQPQDIVDYTGKDKGKGKLIEDKVEENSSVPISKISDVNTTAEIAPVPKVQKKVTFASDTKLDSSNDTASHLQGRFFENGNPVRFDVNEYNKKNITKAIISSISQEEGYTTNKESTSYNENDTSSSSEYKKSPEVSSDSDSDNNKMTKKK
jgi:hypothetical protein